MAVKNKREKVYELFCKGFKPKDAEVQSVINISTGYKYYKDWLKAGKPATYKTKMGRPSTKKALKAPIQSLGGGEQMGSIEEREPRAVITTQGSPQEIPHQLPEPEPEEGEADAVEELWPEDRRMEEENEPEEYEEESGEDDQEEPSESEREDERVKSPKGESIQPIKASPPETKAGKNGHKDSADIAGTGVGVVVNLSLKTLALYQIASSRSGEALLLGDFIDGCVEDFFQGRGQDLGLVALGGKRG